MTIAQMALNRALRAEADLEMAMMLLKNGDAWNRNISRAVATLHDVVDRSHKLLDAVPSISPRSVSHLGLPARVALVIKQLNRGIEYRLDEVSTNSLEIMRSAYVRNKCDVPKEIVAELEKRGME